jgi:hypothetical protein
MMNLNGYRREEAVVASYNDYPGFRPEGQKKDMENL